MQPSSPVSQLQSVEVGQVISNPKYSPRLGQAEALNYLTSCQIDRALFILPTAYGKTHAALGGYAILKARGIVNRCFYLVPTDQQRDQVYQELNPINERCIQKELGVEILKGYVCEKVSRDIRMHREGRAEVFIATYQQLVEREGIFHEIMQTGDWLVVYDEAHHLAESNTWALNTGSLPNTSFRIWLSATPLRTDKAALFGVPSKPSSGGMTYDAAVSVSLKDAVKEGAIRSPCGHISDYFVDVIPNDATVPIRITTEDLLNEKVQNFSVYETKRKLRYSTKYLARMFSDAVAKLDCKNLLHPGEHQMLVFCMTCSHAEAVCLQLNSIYPGFAEWIGITRSEKENRDILKRFQSAESDLQCLIQVNKAGEGFNNKRCSVLMFLNLVKSDLSIVQQIGRGLRRNQNVPADQDVCDIFASKDTAIAERIMDLESEVGIYSDADGGKKRTDSEDLLDIPNIDIANVLHRKTELIAPGSYVDRIAEVARKYRIDESSFRASLAELGHPRANETQKPIDMDIAYWKPKVARAVGVLAGNVLRLTANGSVEKSKHGDICRSINARWVRFNRPADEMLAHEYQQKYYWLKDLNEAIKSEGRSAVPLWLKL